MICKIPSLYLAAILSSFVLSGNLKERVKELQLYSLLLYSLPSPPSILSFFDSAAMEPWRDLFDIDLFTPGFPSGRQQKNVVLQIDLLLQKKLPEQRDHWNAQQQLKKRREQGLAQKLNNSISAWGHYRSDLPGPYRTNKNLLFVGKEFYSNPKLYLSRMPAIIIIYGIDVFHPIVVTQVKKETT